MTLALPVGYVRLSATLVRYSPNDSGKCFFVFRIQDSKDRSKYEEYLDSVESESARASRDKCQSRLAIIEAELDRNSPE